MIATNCECFMRSSSTVALRDNNHNNHRNHPTRQPQHRRKTDTSHVQPRDHPIGHRPASPNSNFRSRSTGIGRSHSHSHPGQPADSPERDCDPVYRFELFPFASYQPGAEGQDYWGAPYVPIHARPGGWRRGCRGGEDPVSQQVSQENAYCIPTRCARR